MDLQAYVDEIKLKLTGGVLKLELTDDVIVKLINSAMREVQRYIDTTRLITVPYSGCIDLTEYKVSSVSRVFRTQSYIAPSVDSSTDAYADPMYLGMWQMASGLGGVYNVSNWALNYGAWNTALQARNTLSTDLLFRFEKHTNKLYINCAFDLPANITIEYVPLYEDVSEITSDFWIDMLVNLSVALAKVTLGRIRTKFNQSNALWGLDTNILQEGQEELNALREQMKASTQLTYGID